MLHRSRIFWKYVFGLALVAAVVLGGPRAARADDDYAQLVDRIALLAFHYAWPTAEYRSYECCVVRGVPGRVIVTFRLHGRSAFGGGHLWTDVNIALGKNGIEAFGFGDNNAILAQPGQTMGALFDVLRALNDQAQLGPPQAPPVGPAPPAQLPPPAPPPPPEPQYEPPPTPPPPPVESPQWSAPPAPPPPPPAVEGGAARVSPGDPGLQWLLRLSGGGESGSQKGLKLSYPNTFGSATVNVEVLRSIRLASEVYVMGGVTVGAGAAAGQRCTVAVSCQGDTCTCPADTGKWEGFAGRYGPVGALAFAWKQDNGFYTVVSLPKLRVEHLVAETEGRNAACASAYGATKCSGWSWANVAFTGAMTFDFGHAPWGCGLQLGLGALVGDLAARDHGTWMAEAQFAYSVAL